MSPRPSLANLRRPQILEAACHAIAERGYERVRLSDVAAHAGVGIGVVQHYFPSRDQLLHDAFWFVNERAIDAWRRAVDLHDHPWQRLEHCIDYWGSDGDDWLDMWQVWFELWPISRREQELREATEVIYERWREPLRRAIADGVARGLFQPRAPVDDITDLILGLGDGLGIMQQLGHRGMPHDRMRRIILRQLELALGYPASAAGTAADEAPPLVADGEPLAATPARS